MEDDQARRQMFVKSLHSSIKSPLADKGTCRNSGWWIGRMTWVLSNPRRNTGFDVSSWARQDRLQSMPAAIPFNLILACCEGVNTWGVRAASLRDLPPIGGSCWNCSLRESRKKPSHLLLVGRSERQDVCGPSFSFQCALTCAWMSSVKSCEKLVYKRLPVKDPQWYTWNLYIMFQPPKVFEMFQTSFSTELFERIHWVSFVLSCLKLMFFRTDAFKHSRLGKIATNDIYIYIYIFINIYIYGDVRMKSNMVFEIVLGSICAWLA